MKKALTGLVTALSLMVPAGAAFAVTQNDAPPKAPEVAQSQNNNNNDDKGGDNWGLLGLTGLLGLFGLAGRKKEHNSGAYRASGSTGPTTTARA